MVGLLLASHGEMSKGMNSSLHCIMGDQENVRYLTLNIEDDITEKSEEMKVDIEELDDGDGVLVMVDILGGSPCNMASKLVREKNIRVLTGMNLPMLFAFIEGRLQGMNLNDVAAHCLEESTKAVYDLQSFMNVK